jgi:hypothetical protein
MVQENCADEPGRDQMDGGEKTMGLTAAETRARKGERQEKKASRVRRLQKQIFQSRDKLTRETIGAEEKKN